MEYRAHLLAVLALGAFGSGCALLPQFGEPPASVPVVATEDSTRTRIPDPELWPTAAEMEEAAPQTAESAPAKPKAQTPTAPRDPATREPAEVVPVDSSAVEVAPAVKVSPTGQAVEEIETETLASLREARRLIATVDLLALDTAGQDKLRIVRGFITQAEDALARQDIEAAAGLARKARLLAVELTAR